MVPKNESAWIDERLSSNTDLELLNAVTILKANDQYLSINPLNLK